MRKKLTVLRRAMKDGRKAAVEYVPSAERDWRKRVDAPLNPGSMRFPQLTAKVSVIKDH